MAKPYSNRELDQFFKSADERASSFHGQLMNRMDDFEKTTGQALGRIEEQTKRTNGSVASLKLWRAYTTGALAIVSLLMIGLLFPLCVIYLQNIYTPVQFEKAKA